MTEIIVSIRKFSDSLEPKACVIRKEKKHEAFILTKSGEWRDCAGIHLIADDEKLDIDKQLYSIDKPT